MWLVVGLGNPGPRYAAHRHNVGFMVIDRLADQLRADAARDKFSGHLRSADVEGERLWLLQPQTFMNVSGASVQPAAAFFKVDPAHVLVIHDELDVPYGEVRLKLGGGHAGHNGLRSIMERLGSADFVRVRVGIGRPPPRVAEPALAAAGGAKDPAEARLGPTGKGERDVAAFVLSDFSVQEAETLPGLLKKASQSVLEVALRGLQPAMKTINTRPPRPRSAG